MNVKSASGLTLVELVVIVAILFAFAAALAPYASCSSSVRMANLVAAGARGKDIWVAITGANTEREALGLPPLWPRDFDPASDTSDEERALFSVTNSTDYFRALYDEDRLGTSDWAPYVAGFDYGKLAGAGVSACPNGQRLSETNNMWTVAKNVRHDMDDIVPVLVTRNVDASSLAARVGPEDLKTKSLHFDPAWRMPFGSKGYILIRKGGAIFKGRSKCMAYRAVYAKQTFDTALTTNGMTAQPLKYLTPTREVVLDDQGYAEEAALAYRLAGGRWGALKRNVRDFFAGVWLIALFFAVLYLPFFAYSVTRRKLRGLPSAASGAMIRVWGCHWLAMTFYAASLFGQEEPWFWGYVGAAVASQALGIALALVLQRSDRATRWRHALWMVLVPVELAALLVLSSFCCVCM
jgi:hypothetical protein